VIPGMVTWEDIEAHKLDWGEDSPLYVASVLGQFPASIGDRIVTLQQATDAVARTLEPSGAPVLAVDVAGRGTDRTVFLRRDGPVARVLRKQAYTDNLMETVGWVAAYCAEHPEVGRVVVDAVGIGFGVSSRLRELASLGQFAPVVEEFIGGANASDAARFVDRNAEAWWAMRQAFVDGTIDVENDSALIAQVTSRKWAVKSDRRIAIQSKAELAKSPDEADALAMSFAPPQLADFFVL